MNIVCVSGQLWTILSRVSDSIDAFRRKLSNMRHNICLPAPDYPGATDFDHKTNVKNVFRFRSYKLCGGLCLNSEFSKPEIVNIAEARDP